ncbi:MAG: hypothetical protein ACRC7O_11730, partial [Fimbriiglobus sp.]
AELVVRNGKRRGTRLPVPLPVAVVGAGRGADIRVTGMGIADAHCLIAATSAGPVLRSFAPDLTLVNGTPTAAGPLKDGDEIQVGPCLFQLVWPAAHPLPVGPSSGHDTVPVTPDEFAALRAQAAAVVAQQAMLADTEGTIRDREDSLTEQESQLADVFRGQEGKLADLHAGLAVAREKLRTERAEFDAEMKSARTKLAATKARIRPLHTKAKQDRKRARALYQRFSEHLRKRWSTQRQTIDREWADLERLRLQTTADADRVAADRARAEADAAAQQYRLRDAWELIQEGQRRLIADRQQSDAVAAERDALVTARETEVTAREQAFAAVRTRAEDRLQALRDEADRLETRTTRARAVLQDLEEKRAALEAGFAAGTDPSLAAFPDVVALDRRADGGVERLLTELHVREREVAREKQTLAAVRSEIDRRSERLADDRLVLAEQVAALSVARDRWQNAERQSLAELESLARSVQARELFLLSRERDLSAAEGRFRRRQGELDGYRAKLDGWQTSLTAHEATASAARDQADAEVSARRRQLTRWEAALTTLCRKWADARKRDRDTLVAELARWATARTEIGAKLASVDRTRATLLADAARVAELALAAEQAALELTSPKDRAAKAVSARRLRILRKSWESHFARARRDADARLISLAAESAAANNQLAALQRSLLAVTEKRAEFDVTEAAAETDRLIRDREFEERSAVLSVETARSKRTEAALAAVREEVDRMAAALMADEPASLLESDADLPGVIALRPAAMAA